MNQNHQRRILVTGATGYVGGRLLKMLQRRGYLVRVLARRPEFLHTDSLQPLVIGSGSLSFEMIRALVERLPIMITPHWVRVKAQPIAIADLLAYLLEAMSLSVDGHRTIEIGGVDQVSYRKMD